MVKCLRCGAVFEAAPYPAVFDDRNRWILVGAKRQRVGADGLKNRRRAVSDQSAAAVPWRHVADLRGSPPGAPATARALVKAKAAICLTAK